MKVALDISKIVEHYFRVENKFGIARVIEEVLGLLSQHHDVKIFTTSLCLPHKLMGSIQLFHYLQDKQNDLIDSFLPTYQSRIQLSKMYQQFHKFEWLAPEMTNRLEQAPKYRFNYLPIRVFRKLINKFASFDLAPYFDTSKFDIFHSTYLPLPPKAITKNLTRFLTIYDLIPVVTPKFAVKELQDSFKQVISSIDINKDWVISISEFTKQEFCEYTGMSSKRVIVTPLAASAHFRPVTDKAKMIAVREKYKIPNEPYFYSLAAPQPRKNISQLISSFVKLVESEPNFKATLVLGGSKTLGFMYDDIFELLERSKKAKLRIHFTGYIEEMDMSALYSGATAFVFPSLYEGFGLPILEAMQCGSPIIASNTTSIPEVVGDAGTLVDPLDEEALSHAMFKLYKDTKLQDEMRIKGLTQAKKFSWERCANATINAYQLAILNN